MERQNNSVQDRSNPQTPQRFFKLLEAGDLAFQDFMQYAIVVFGITKHGKTTFSHHLACHSLQAYLNTDNTVNYRLATETDKKSDARIGATMQSQTQIPNKFPTKLLEGEKPIFLIDNPGQKDSFGINRVLSNAYFHYRIFSKIQNMKIILLFDYPTFSGKIQETNSIFNNFFKCFSNFGEVKDQLLKSIAFVFTKVEKSFSQSDICARLKSYLADMKIQGYFEKDKEDFIANLINACVGTEYRINIFRKAEIGVHVEVNPKLISGINNSLEFFSRDVAQNDEYGSKFFTQKKVSMQSIKFSQTNKVMSLAQNETQKNRTLKLFEEITCRGEKMFQIFFEVLSQLISYILFDKENNGGNSKNRINQTEIIIEKRRKALKQIIENFKNCEINYDNTEKYQIQREQILKRYGQSFKGSQKAQNFIERLVLATQFYEFGLKYTDNTVFLQRNEGIINKFRKDFESIMQKISQLYASDNQIEILSQFMYSVNTLLNQIIIVCMIILPNSDKKDNFNGVHEKAGQPTEYLLKFLKCFTSLPKFASKMDHEIGTKLRQQFNIGSAALKSLDKITIMHQYLKKFPTIIIDQGDRQDKILKTLFNSQISMEHKIHCQILVFKYLQKKFYFLSELKTFDEQDKAKVDLISSPEDKKERRIKKEQVIEPIPEKDVRCLIKSFIIYLKSVKKMKQLSQYQDFVTYKAQIYEINYLVWTYIVKLFCLLIQANNVSDDWKEDYKEILIEIVSTSKNHTLIQQVFDTLLQKNEKSFKQLSLKSSSIKFGQQTQKRVKILSSDNLKYYLASKQTLSKEIIILTLAYAELLNDLGLKDKALTHCYNSMKYTEFSPSEIIRIEDMILKIKSKNIGLRIEENFRSVTQFEATIQIKKLLGRFLKQNANVKQLQCVNCQFLN